MRDDGSTFSVLLLSVCFYGMECGERVKFHGV